MRYEVLWLQRAVDDLFRLAERNSRQAHRVLLTVRSFGRDGQGDLKKLEGRRGEWRLRAGDWRTHMELEGAVAYITEVENRRDAY